MTHKMIADCTGFKWFDTKTYMIHVAPFGAGWRTASFPERAIDRHQVNEAAPGAQLHQTEIVHHPLDATTQYLAVEALHALQINNTQYHMVDVTNLDHFSGTRISPISVWFCPLIARGLPCCTDRFIVPGNPARATIAAAARMSTEPLHCNPVTCPSLVPEHLLAQLDPPTQPGRRVWLRTTTGLAAMAATGALPGAVTAQATRPRPPGSDPFVLGVASGDPRPDGFVLWTRLDPTPLPEHPGDRINPSSDIEITYEIAADPELRRIVQRGKAIAEARHGHSVHLAVAGLDAQRPYWYRFGHDGFASRIGHARTLPRPDEAVGVLRAGFVSCANFEHGYFSAYRHLADERPDIVVLLGDYLYEYIDRSPNKLRHHSDNQEPVTLQDWRRRYAQYRLDPDLQRMHADCTVLATWDDHEVQNNYANLWSNYGIAEAEFAPRRQAAYQAFYEFMPIHPQRWQAARGEMRLYDHYRFGLLAGINLLDTRQYRSLPRCTAALLRRQPELPCRNGDSLGQMQSMLGVAQENWLSAQLAQDNPRWNLFAQGVVMAQTRRPAPAGTLGSLSNDSWDGFPASRARFFEQLSARRVSNPLVLSGDIHAFCAADLKRDFDAAGSPVIASEFSCGSIASHGPGASRTQRTRADNPHLHHLDGAQRGYTLLEIRPDRVRCQFRVVDDAKRRDTRVSTQASWVIENGRAGVLPESRVRS